MTQRQLPVVDAKESRAERLARILAGVPKVQTAAKFFDEAAYAAATARERGGRIIEAGRDSAPPRWQ